MCSVLSNVNQIISKFITLEQMMLDEGKGPWYIPFLTDSYYFQTNLIVFSHKTHYKLKAYSYSVRKQEIQHQWYDSIVAELFWHFTFNLIKKNLNTFMKYMNVVYCNVAYFNQNALDEWWTREMKWIHWLYYICFFSYFQGFHVYKHVKIAMISVPSWSSVLFSNHCIE